MSHFIMELCKGRSVFARILVLMFLSCPVRSGTTESTPDAAFITTVRIAPRNVTEQREGDTVSLLCEVVHFDVRRHALYWSHSTPNETMDKVIASSVVVSTIDSFVSTFREIDRDSSTYVLNLTIPSLTQMDTRLYSCNLDERVGQSSTFRIRQQVDLDLAVYAVADFPTCDPNGPATVIVGHRILCITEATATPVVSDSSGWTEILESGGQNVHELTKEVKDADDRKTFVCKAVIPSAALNLSCSIGPLTVLPSRLLTSEPPRGLSTTLLDGTTQAPVASCDQETGLTIAGVVGFTIVATFLSTILLMLLAVHIFCYRCNLKKWLTPISSVRDFLNTCGTSVQQSSDAGGTTSPNPDGQGSGPETGNLPTGQQPDNYMKLNPVDQSPRVYTDLRHYENT